MLIIKLNQKGFTLIELIMVISLIAIISAIIIPNVIDITDKARLKSDIQSAKIIQNALDLYKTEYGKDIEPTTTAEGKYLEGQIANLVAQGYLKGSQKTQTPKAVWEQNAAKNMVIINVNGCDAKIKTLSQNLTDEEQLYISLTP